MFTEQALNEIPHVTISGIKLDKTAPTGSITLESSTSQTTSVILSLSATDDISGVAQMRFSNDNYTWSIWEPYQTTKTWTLLDGEGLKTVFVQFNNNAGLTSTYNCNLTIEMALPSATPNPTNIPVATPAVIPSETPETTNSPISTLSPTLAPHQSPILTTSPDQSSAPTLNPDLTNDILPNNSQTPPALPEIPLWTLTIFVLLALLIAPVIKKKTKTKP